MNKKLLFTALSLVLMLGLAAPASAEIIDYGYGSSYGSAYGYGGSYGYGGQYQYPYGGTTYPGIVAGASTMALSRDLTVGSFGSDVLMLENFLRMRGLLAAQGTGYFSIATRDAVIRFQATNGISPVTGYVGPLTRAYINAQMGSVLGVSTQYPYGYPHGTMYPYSYQTGCPSGTYPMNYGGQIGCVSSDDDDDDDNDDDLGGGSATLRSFSFDSRDTTLREGENGVEVAEASFRVSGGDVRVERVEFVFDSVGGNNTDSQPWRVFERLRLTCDGDEAQEMDVDSSSDWTRDGDAYLVEFDDLDDCIVDEGDTAELVLEIDVANSVTGANDSRIEWEIAVNDDGITVEDGDGDEEEIGEDSDTVRIRITD